MAASVGESEAFQTGSFFADASVEGAPPPPARADDAPIPVLAEEVTGDNEEFHF